MSGWDIMVMLALVVLAVISISLDSSIAKLDKRMKELERSR